MSNLFISRVKAIIVDKLGVDENRDCIKQTSKMI
jgi:hypothetical protein